MSAQRIQLSRARGWRKPEGAVVVSRPSRWGNPWRVLRCAGDMPGWRTLGNGECAWSADDDQPWTRMQAAEHAVERFRTTIPPTSVRARDAQIELRGHDLACWCPLVDEQGNPWPCHADVLLEIANGDAP